MEETTTEEIRTEGTRMEEIRTDEKRMEEIRTEETRMEEIRTEETRMEEIRTDGKIMEEIRTEETRMEEIRTKETRMEEIRTDEKRMEEIRTEETRMEEIRTEETRMEEIRTEETRMEEIRTEETRIEKPKTEDIRTAEITQEITKHNITSEDITTEDITMDDVKMEDIIMEDIITEDITTEDITTEVITTEDITTENITMAESTIEEITIESLRARQSNTTWYISLNDYVMGESGCTLTVIDVADNLQTRYAFISGGCAASGAPIITFSSNSRVSEVSEEDYHDVVTYLTSIPSLQEVDVGFVLIIDRRTESWKSAKTLLLRISGFFPGQVQQVIVLRPSGFLQKTIAEVGFKRIKDSLKYKVLMCDTIADLHTHIDPSQLTEDLGGSLKYDHKEWIQHRAAIEKFSANTTQIGATIRDLCGRLQEAEFPNDVTTTEALIQSTNLSKADIKDDLKNTIRHGEILLACFKGAPPKDLSFEDEDGEAELRAALVAPSSDLPSMRLVHVTAIERLLVQLVETESNFDKFWTGHQLKLNQCLLLRRFEEDFKQLQYIVECHLVALKGMVEIGDSIQRVETLLRELTELDDSAKEDIEHAETLESSGRRFIEEDHYAIDCIRPKCIELQQMVQQYREMTKSRFATLHRSQDLHERIDKANKWCTRGVDLLAGQQIDQSTNVVWAQRSLDDINKFLESASDLKLDCPREFHVHFDGILSATTQELVRDVIHRIDDVKNMCEKRRQNLRKLTEKPVRPVQPVAPEQVAPPAGSHKHHNADRKRKRLNHREGSTEKGSVEIVTPHWSENERVTSHDANTHNAPHRALSVDPERAKQGTKWTFMRHVMNELIESERIYVAELHSILQGYAAQLDNMSMQHLVPPLLRGQKHILFGNMQQIYEFHSRAFLTDLENCRKTPGLVGRCFVQRREEFQMYSSYCQNKLASESLIQKVGDNCPFFKKCQQLLCHKLSLGAYLLKPVQRVTKYQLLLKEMLKYTESDVDTVDLQEAMKVMLQVVKYANDIMHQGAITGHKGELSVYGRLLMQGAFSVWAEHKSIRELRFKAMLRHMFLYEKAILFCKKKEDEHSGEKTTYLFKNSLQMARVGLTENVKGDKRKFELWLHGRSEVYIIQAPTQDVKDIWTSEIKQVLLSQFDLIKETVKKTHEVDIGNSPSVTTTPQSTCLPRSQSAPTQSSKIENNNIGAPSGVSRGMSAVAASCDEVVGTAAEDEEEEWSSDDYEEIDPNIRPPAEYDYNSEFQGPGLNEYVALATYAAASDSQEMSLQEGDLVEVLRYEREGWWYVHHPATGQEGWVPCTYLKSTKRNSAYSSTVSSVSTASLGKSPDMEAEPDTEVAMTTE